MRKKSFLLIVLTILLLASINIGTEAAGLNKASVKLIKGQSYQLTVKGTRRKAKWKSSNNSVVSVSSNGKINARKKGASRITATISGRKYICNIKIYNVLTPKQAEKAVLKFCSKKYFRYCSYGTEKKGSTIIVWIRYGTGAQGKYIVNSKTGKVNSYAPYWGRRVDPNMPVRLENKFNALNYL